MSSVGQLPPKANLAQTQESRRLSVSRRRHGLNARPAGPERGTKGQGKPYFPYFPLSLSPGASGPEAGPHYKKGKLGPGSLPAGIL